MSSVSRFLMAMIMYPKVQIRVQEEIERVVGSERLPGLSDKDSLPYVEAVMKEVFRWQMMTPIAVPHRLMEDDKYRGYHLPKGATVIPNNWAISRDPEMYPDPDEFRPERFLPSDMTNMPMDPRTIVFG